jgi:hypothetical protein
MAGYAYTLIAKNGVNQIIIFCSTNLTIAEYVIGDALSTTNSGGAPVMLLQDF